ncbi:MAG: response regulator [Sediminibacterium sp.]
MTGDQPSDIILAEDDFDDVYIFELALKKIPFYAVLRHAADGDKLFVELQKLVPDFLFLDIDLPCKKGTTCLAEIRRDKRYDNMPVIMLTSFASKEFVETSYRSGANFFIGKVSSITDLAGKLKQVFAFNWKQNMIYPTIDQFVISRSPPGE